MNRKEFVNGMHEKYNISKKQANIELMHVLEYMVDVIESGQNIEITGYLKVRLKEVQERMGRNPKTGEEVFIPTHNQVRVSVGKKLKEAVK
jgi:nucleoid DNA-binding protein